MPNNSLTLSGIVLLSCTVLVSSSCGGGGSNASGPSSCSVLKTSVNDSSQSGGVSIGLPAPGETSTYNWFGVLPCQGNWCSSSPDIVRKVAVQFHGTDTCPRDLTMTLVGPRAQQVFWANQGDCVAWPGPGVPADQVYVDGLELSNFAGTVFTGNWNILLASSGTHPAGYRGRVNVVLTFTVEYFSPCA